MFKLDMKSRKTIYEQVVDNLKELIMSDALSSEEKLPSVRELSKTITVNPNTVQKAYRELESQGYVYSISGVGTFVSDKKEISASPKMIEEAKERLDEAFKNLLYLGLDFVEAEKIALDIIEKRRMTND